MNSVSNWPPNGPHSSLPCKLVRPEKRDFHEADERFYQLPYYPSPLFRSPLRQPVGRQQGFTLIEVMLVIVIIGIFSAMAVMSVSGIDQRRILQQREQLINDLHVVRLEASDQGRVFALVAQAANASQPAGYRFIEYQPALRPALVPPAFTGASSGSLNAATPPLPQEHAPEKPLWKPAEGFKARDFSDGAVLQIRALDAQSTRFRAARTGLTDPQSPVLIWFGNGEVKPARLQVIYQNQPLGSPIYVNSVGAVSDSEQVVP